MGAFFEGYRQQQQAQQAQELHKAQLDIMNADQKLREKTQALKEQAQQYVMGNISHQIALATDPNQVNRPYPLDSQGQVNLPGGGVGNIQNSTGLMGSLTQPKLDPNISQQGYQSPVSLSNPSMVQNPTTPFTPSEQESFDQYNNMRGEQRAYPQLFPETTPTQDETNLRDKKAQFNRENRGKLYGEYRQEPAQQTDLRTSLMGPGALSSQQVSPSDIANFDTTPPVPTFDQWIAARKNENSPLGMIIRGHLMKGGSVSDLLSAYKQDTGQNPSDENPNAEKDLNTEADRLIKLGELKPTDKFSWKQQQRATQAGMNTGARTEEALQAQMRYASSLSEAHRRGTLIADISLLPQLVGAKVQEELNVRTSPANIKKMSELIGAETLARTKNAPVPEMIQEKINVLLDYQRVITSIKDDFTPAERANYVGFLQLPLNRITQIKNKDPRFADFSARLGKMETYAFTTGGKQLTTQEKELTDRYIPTGRELSVADFEAKLALADGLTDSLIKSNSVFTGMSRGELATQGPPKITSPSPPTGSKKSGTQSIPTPKNGKPPTEEEGVPLEDYLKQQRELRKK